MLVAMVTRWLGCRGLDAGGLSGSLAAYSTVFIPLSSSLYSDKALKFFLWVSEKWNGPIFRGDGLGLEKRERERWRRGAE